MPITESRHTPTGKPLTAAQFPVRDYRTVKANKLKQMDVDIKEVVKNLMGTTQTSFYGILTKVVTAHLFAVLTDMLEWAVAIAPYDTGELRRSGVVNAFTKSGTSMLVADTDADASGDFTVTQNIKELTRPTPRIQAEISFSRGGSVKDEEGNVIAADVALWAHEELLPYSPRPKKESLRDKWVATKPSPIPQATGPKYLSRAVDKYKHRLVRMMDVAKDDAMAIYNAKYAGGRARRPSPPPSTTPPPRSPTRKQVWAYQAKQARRTGFRPSYKKAKQEVHRKMISDWAWGR